MPIELAFLISSGRAFHNVGPLIENDLPPALVRHLGTRSRNCDAYLKSQEGYKLVTAKQLNIQVLGL